MKLIIAGSRTFNFYETEHSVDTSLIDKALHIFNLQPTEVVCGCGGTKKEIAERKKLLGSFASDQGIDRLGEFWADGNVDITIFPADWDQYGKLAGPKRNRQMAEYADALLLIWDGRSKGSYNMKRQMETLGKPVYEIILAFPKKKKNE